MCAGEKAISQLKELKPKIVLDVATGTADVALLTYEMLKPERIVGIDISDGMLDLGRKKIERRIAATNTAFNGDSATINFPDETFDAVTVAFGVRNFEHL